jgi:aryl-alcohol dehydrogenase-like predicted oxidoreductase
MVRRAAGPDVPEGGSAAAGARMQYTTLGRTGLRVSVAGLGCGGFSRLGSASGKSEAESVALVRQAIEVGINFLDTAASYGTEAIVGKAIRGLPRDRVVVATKAQIRQDGRLCSAREVIDSLDHSLRMLGTDHVDLFQLHGVPPAAYDHAMQLVPALLAEQAKGKFRHLGITETAPNDPSHLMLQRAVQDGCWQVVMLAFHMLNQNARDSVLPRTREHRVGTLLMFVVRSLFSVPGRLAATMRQLAAEGRVPAWLAEREQPLDFLIHADTTSVIDAAYRYVRHEPGADVVLFGTGDVAHLKSNVGSILKPPLPAADVAQLTALFGALEGIGLDLPRQP